jgi:dimeric dUTPase (all-alpha-NTP-PPase superfamily)
MSDQLNELFNMQLELQTTGYGHDFAHMETADRVEFIKWNALGVQSEIAEAMQETSWKPWATGNYVDRDPYVGELVDTLKFLLNLMLVVEVTPQELMQRFRGKTVVNYNRQATGYDGRSTKCECGRALDEPKAAS